MTHAPHNYAPRADSLAARVIAFFRRADPDEELHLSDIELKFDTPKISIHAALKEAVTHDILKRNNSMYSAGPHIGSTPPQGVAAIAAARRNAPQLAPDLSQLQVDYGVEIVGRFKKENVWAPVFDALTAPGVSAVIQPEWRKSLKVEATKRQRAQQGAWQIGIDAQGKTRILRTA